MQRKPNIKWRKSDTEKLAQTIKNFNAKISYHEKAHPELKSILPDKITSSEKKQMIEDFKKKTRQDFNREIKSLKRFQNKGAELPYTNKAGLTTTKWEKREYAIAHATVERMKAREREDYDTSRENIFLGVKKQKELEPKQNNFEKISSKRQWELTREAIEKKLDANFTSDTMEKYKTNYMNCIQINLGEAGDELLQFINQVPADVLYRHYWEDDEILKIQFTSDPLPAQDIADVTLEHWRNALGLEEGESYWDIDSDFPSDE